MIFQTFTSVRHYLQETLGIEVQIAPWPESRSLPFALRDEYDLSKVRILGSDFLLLAAYGQGELTPARIDKQIKWLTEASHLQAIFVAEAMPAYNRKRLIEQKVPFIVPGNQLYLPDLGIDLREHIRRERSKKTTLGPAAQVVVLFHLLKEPVLSGWTATGLAGQLDYAKMTMSRAIDELESLQLVEVTTEGREKQVRFVEKGRKLWERALPFLKSPVNRRVYVEALEWPVGVVAGLGALSQLTILSPPPRQTRALISKEWTSLQADVHLRIIPERSRELAPVELEIWRYEPAKLSSSGMVDPLSLYLSLRHDKDERVEGALEQLLENHPW